MDLKQMYNISHRIGTHGIQGYDVANKYEDLNARKKIVRSHTDRQLKNTQSERVSYMRQQQKASRGIPGPGAYNIPEEAHTTGSKVKSRSVKNIKRTYVDELIERAKKQKLPAPGQYSYEDVRKQFNKKRDVGGDKRTYLDEVQYEANETPGPGAYNPHEIKSRILANRKDPNYWIQKAINEEKNRRPPVQPDMGSYHPNTVTYKLFSNSTMPDGKPKSDFSRDSRFEADRPKKSKIPEPPGPGQYAVQGRWRGKSDSKKRVNILDRIAQPPARSIYY